MIRCKFSVESIKEFSPACDGTPSEVVMRAVHDPSIPEDRQFVKFTPSGTLEVRISNPAALTALRANHYFYLDLTPIITE